jgi:hypothetical protein
MPAIRCQAAASVDSCTDVVGFDLSNDIGLSGFHTTCVRVQRQLRLPSRGHPRWLARELGVVDLAVRRRRSIARSRWIRHELLRAGGRRSVGQPQRGSVLQTGRVRGPAPVAAIGQQDFSPLGGPRSQVTGPAMRQLDMVIARQFRIPRQKQFEIRAEVFNLTNTPAFELPGSLNFADARNFASITTMRNKPRQFQLGAKLYW